jgi:ThiC-associated domain
MIAPKDSIDSQSTETALPNSRKAYVGGKLHREVCVPFREISLAPTKSMNGEIEVNEPVHVYDTSGPWGDPDFHGDVTQGLPALRAKWIRDQAVSSFSRSSGYPALVRSPGNHHPRDGIHRDPGKRVHRSRDR